MTKKIFEKRYDTESLFDLERDVSEAVEEIPSDEGTVTVTITWNSKETYERIHNHSS